MCYTRRFVLLSYTEEVDDGQTVQLSVVNLTGNKSCLLERSVNIVWVMNIAGHCMVAVVASI